MEYEGYCTKEEAERQVRAMVEEGFRMRSLQLKEVLVQGIDHRVEKTGSGYSCCSAGLLRLIRIPSVDGF